MSLTVVVTGHLLGNYEKTNRNNERYFCVPVPYGFVYLDDLRNSDHCINILFDMKTIITLLAIILLSSCAAKKKSMESVSTLVKNDSVYIKKETIKSPGGSYSLSIHEICDTITGEPKTITQYITRGNDSIALLLDKTNGLRLNITSQAKTISQLTHEKEKALEELASIKSETFVKYKVPKWAWYTLVFSILNIVYWLNRVFRFFSFPF